VCDSVWPKKVGCGEVDRWRTARQGEGERLSGWAKKKKIMDEVKEGSREDPGDETPRRMKKVRWLQNRHFIEKHKRGGTLGGPERKLSLRSADLLDADSAQCGNREGRVIGE